MKFKRLLIDNIRSYQSLDLDFKDGVTVISGVNGSGKSSILEACFMGIFGGEVLRGTTLQIFDMIRKGSQKASIVLDFEHGGADYQIEQHYRVTKTGANNSKSILRKNGEIIAEQTKNTYEAIKNLLNMDEVSFQNCAYIRQGDVDALINAKPKERQQMIDDLLRLGKLEEYRERAHSSKTAVTRVLRAETEKKEALDEKIAQLRNKNPYHELNRRQEAVEKINELVLEKTKEKDNLSAELTLLESKLKELEKEKMEIENLKKESSELNRKYEEEISKQEKLLLEIQNVNKKKNQLSALSEQLRIEINRSNSESVFLKENARFYIGESGDKNKIESALSIAKAEESKALAEQHDFSKKAEVIGVQKNNLKKDIFAKEKEINDFEKSISDLSSQIERQILKINAANASVEGGFSTADTEKKAFLEIFDELYNDIRDSKAKNFSNTNVSGFDSDSKTNVFQKDCISDVCDISFYSNVVKVEDLPLPSAESSWRTLISDIENLENFIVLKVREEEAKVTEEEKKKASLKGELEEKSKNKDEIQKELNRLDEEIEKVQLKLKTEFAEAEMKKKRISDFEALFAMHQSKRTDKIKQAAALKETVPASRYALGDISSKDITNAISVLSQKKETLISECAGLKSSDREIEKSILKKEALLKAGKCPTCGQEIKSDSAHRHEAADEVKQREEIALRLKEIKILQDETDSQISILKAISEIDSGLEQIQSELNTHRAEEKGKSELIAKFKKDLEEINGQKKTVHARYLEYSVFCEAHQKSLKTIELKLADFKSVVLRRQEKLKLLSIRKKSFSNSSNSILMDYKTLEAERKMSSESQKRSDELKKSIEASQSLLNQLKSDFEKIAASEIQIKAEVEAAFKKLNFLSNMRADIEKIVELNKEQETINAVIAGLKSTSEALSKTLENYQTQISEKNIKAQTLTEKMNAELSFGVSSLPETKKKLSTQIDLILKSINDLNATKMNILEEIGKIRSEIDQLTENEKEIHLLRNKLLFLSYVSEDVSVLEEMYLRIRAEMRAKNIEALDILLNEMFDFIYSNNAYSHLELDGEYNLKVHEKDGSILEPKQLSGGERAIFNLALRCAIYRLLSLGFGEQNAGQTSLPPLIFDEPTVFLDSGHVRRLIKLIEHMRQDGVGQIIVVSHDESLIDSADVNFRIEKDPLTNASHVV